MVLRRQCDVATIENFIRYYTGGWIGWPDYKGVIQPITLYGGPRTPVEQTLRMRCLGQEAEKYEMTDKNIEWDDLQKNAHFGRPNVGMLQDTDSIVYLSHRSERNTQRGLRLDRVVRHGFNDWHIRKARGRSDQRLIARYDLIWAAFNPRYYSLTEALTKLNEGVVVGVPLTQNYGVYTLPDGKYPLLAYKRWTMGYFTDINSVNINPLYTDYIKDIRRRLGVIEVTVQ